MLILDMVANQLHNYRNTQKKQMQVSYMVHLLFCLPIVGSLQLTHAIRFLFLRLAEKEDDEDENDEVR